MSSDFKLQRRSHFQENYLLWIVVRHFLPANLAEELSRAIIGATSDSKFNFDSLFESRVSSGLPIMSSWIVRPQPHATPLGDYLQRFIRGLVWQNDDSAIPITHQVDSADAIAMQCLEASLWVSHLDFDRVDEPSKFHQSAPESLKHFISAIQSLKRLELPVLREPIEAALISISAVPPPLNAILMKHLGDLCGDDDRWDMAIVLYERAASMLSAFRDRPWKALVAIVRTVTSQSHAAALRIIEGPGAASDFLGKITARANFGAGLLTVLNASLDALVAYTSSNDDFNYIDNRPAMLTAPLLLETHNLSYAFQSSIDQEYDNSHRWFWAALRRQIALGSATESRRTKAYYGRSLIESFQADEDKRKTTGGFSVGVRLLIESGFPKIANNINWTSDLIESNVDFKYVTSVITHTRRNRGSVLERTLVTISVFQQWIKLLPPEVEDVAAKMLEFLAEVAADFEWSFFGGQNASRPSFEALRDIGQKRPEFRRLAIKSVITAIVKKLSERDHNAISSALETAQIYINAFDESALNSVVTATLTTLEKFSVDSSAWPVIRPALALLSSTQPMLSHDNQDLQSRVASTLMRFSLGNEFENTNVMYLLRNLDTVLIEEQVDAARLREVVINIRKHALEINSTAAIPNILALLEAPTIALREGVSDAIDGLILILKSAVDGKPSISFSSAYQPILLLTQRQKELSRGLSMSEFDAMAMMKPILELLLQLWRKAPETPLLFAGFAIPPRTVPNPTLVHNWTFASIGIARLLRQEEDMADAMEVATHHPLLETSMAVARAIRASAGDPIEFDIDAIQREKRGAFYPALGQRLVVLSSLASGFRKEVTECLLNQCFRLGPKGLDAGVFAVALGIGIKTSPLSPIAEAYRQRLDNDPQLRLSLLPLFESLRFSPEN